MKSQISWKVGGQQGEGIESTGEIFATAMNILELIYFNANFNSCGSYSDRNITF